MKDTTTRRGHKASTKRRAVRSDLARINPDAAGIDVGSEEHYVAVPEDRDGKPVKVFRCFTGDLHLMAKWLKRCGIKSVALESTGVYWVPVYQVLEEYGFRLTLVNPRQYKNVSGRPTDVGDAQWLQQLHTYGLLTASFRPGRLISKLRAYWRHREEMVKECSAQIQVMQKALVQMNLHLHKVLSDISGLSGMKIIRAIVSGQRSPEKLAQLCHPLVKKGKAAIAEALTGDYREEHIFVVKQALEHYDFLHKQLADCDGQIERYMRGSFESAVEDVQGSIRPSRKGKISRRKNEPHFDLRAELFRITGVDLTQIEGIDALTAQTVISECGSDMKAFPTHKEFSSWLGLSPHHAITGGKVCGRRTRKVNNRAATALRIAAQSLHSSKTALGAYYRRMRARIGAPKAITATAHKLADIIYYLLKYGQEYVDKGQDYYEKMYRDRVMKNLIKRAKEMGYQLVDTKTGVLVS